MPHILRIKTSLKTFLFLYHSAQSSSEKSVSSESVDGSDICISIGKKLTEGVSNRWSDCCFTFQCRLTLIKDEPILISQICAAFEIIV